MACNLDVLKVDRAIPHGHDFVQVCLPVADPEAEETLEGALPGWDCGYGGTFTPCIGGVEMACYLPLESDADGAIPSAQWLPLCGCPFSRPSRPSRRGRCSPNSVSARVKPILRTRVESFAA